VNVGAGRGRPVVSAHCGAGDGSLAGGGDGGCETVETTAESAMRTRSAGIGVQTGLLEAVCVYDNVVLRPGRPADGLTVVAGVMSTGGWMVKMMSEGCRRRILQTKKGLQQ
jgi:hypothetical protein